jgi:hypothetical protein
MIPPSDAKTDHHNIYRGALYDRGNTVEVTVNGAPLDPRFDLHQFSPTGFGWGYGGAGPAQLALAILAHEAGSWSAEMGWCRFEQAILKPLDFDRPFELTSAEIRAFLAGEPLTFNTRWSFSFPPLRFSRAVIASPA